MENRELRISNYAWLHWDFSLIRSPARFAAGKNQAIKNRGCKGVNRLWLRYDSFGLKGWNVEQILPGGVQTGSVLQGIAAPGMSGES